MARFLAYTSPAIGNLYPIVGTLLELRERGHSVTVRTIGSQVDVIGRLSLDVHPIDGDVERITMDDWGAKNPVDAVGRALSTMLARAPAEVRELRRVLEESSPDALFIDVNAWGAGTLAESVGLPWANFVPFPLPLPSRDVPPFGPGLRPMKGMLGRTRDAVVRRVTDRIVQRPLPALNRLRDTLSLEPLRRIEEQMLRASRLVYYTAEPLEYHRTDWPASVRMVGPGLWEPPAPPPSWLAAIHRPLVLVTTSSEYQNDAWLIEATLTALAGEDVFVVATAPSVDTAGIQIPPNARIEKFVPHGPLIERADVVVCHGGMGITQRSLAAGVPVCAVPFGRDQHEVARRLHVCGAGECLPASKLRPDRLRAAIQSARARRSGAERVAAAFAKAGGARAAADLLEALVVENADRSAQQAFSLHGG
jgi:MGT family glycosyltransferase